MKTVTLNIKTSFRTEFVDITRDVQKILRENGCKSGIITGFTTHTTAAVTINENEDPDVQ